MAITKYGIGGSIIQVEDDDGIENRESCDTVVGNATYLVVCSGCGIQHMVDKDEDRKCDCGVVIKGDNN